MLNLLKTFLIKYKYVFITILVFHIPIFLFIINGFLYRNVFNPLREKTFISKIDRYTKIAEYVDRNNIKCSWYPSYKDMILKNINVYKCDSLLSSEIIKEMVSLGISRVRKFDEYVEIDLMYVLRQHEDESLIFYSWWVDKLWKDLRDPWGKLSGTKVNENWLIH